MRIPICLPAFCVIATILPTSRINAQQVKEYIRLGGRVVAIETTTTATPPAWSPSSLPNAAPAGSFGPLTLTVSGAWSVRSSPQVVLRNKTQQDACSAVAPSNATNELDGLSGPTYFCYWVLPNSSRDVLPLVIRATSGGLESSLNLSQQPLTVFLDLCRRTIRNRA